MRQYNRDEKSLLEIWIYVPKGLTTYNSVDRKNYIQLVKWWKYQKPSWAIDSKYPPPEDWTDRYRMHVSGKKIDKLNWDKEGGFNNSLCNGQDSTLHKGIDSDIEKNKRSKMENQNKRKEDDEDNENNIINYGDLIKEFISCTKIEPENDFDNWIKIENELLSDGVIPEDIKTAIDELASKENYRTPSSFLRIKTAAKMVMTKRIQKSEKNDYRSY